MTSIIFDPRIDCQNHRKHIFKLTFRDGFLGQQMAIFDSFKNLQMGHTYPFQDPYPFSSHYFIKVLLLALRWKPETGREAPSLQPPGADCETETLGNLSKQLSILRKSLH